MYDLIGETLLTRQKILFTQIRCLKCGFCQRFLGIEIT